MSWSNQKGISTIEILVAVILIVIFITGIFRLTATSVKSGVFLRELVDVGYLARAKSTELTGKDLLSIMANSNSLGSIAPNSVISNFYDLFDEGGKPLCVTQNGSVNCNVPTGIPAFRRQWQLIKDVPNPGDFIIKVTVTHTTTNRIMRQVVEVKTDSVITR